MYMLKTDDDAPIVTASAASTYAEEDILWTGGTSFPDAPLDAPKPQKDWDLDVKAMRKIRSGESVDIIMTATTVNAVEVSGCVRSLLRLGGN